MEDIKFENSVPEGQITVFLALSGADRTLGPYFVSARSKNDTIELDCVWGLACRLRRTLYHFPSMNYESMYMEIFWANSGSLCVVFRVVEVASIGPTVLKLNGQVLLVVLNSIEFVMTIGPHLRFFEHCFKITAFSLLHQSKFVLLSD